jgi:hypothetical protein
LTALREKDPVTGNEEANDPNKLQMPSVRSSCVASTESPLAEIFNKYREYSLKLHDYITI